MNILYKKQMLALAIAVICIISPLRSAHAAGYDDMLGSICLFAGNYAPYGWAFCDGSILSISQNCALFSLLGNYYGGDGRVNFALPDLRGRVPVHFGQGTGLSNNYVIGYTGGSETVPLSTTQVQLPVNTAALDNSILDSTSDASVVIANPSSVSGASSFSLGGGQSHDNMQPYLALNYIICIYGIYPSRDW